MSRQVEAELLSAYLDGQLEPEEEKRVEELLAADPEVRRQYEGMRLVIRGLGRLERMAPPSTLGQTVARRVALAGERRSLMDRVEDGLSRLNQQPSVLFMFALVLALAMIILFFAWGLQQRQTSLVPVVIQNPPSGPVQMVVAGRVFEQQEDGLWVQEGLEPDSPARRVVLDSEDGRRLLATWPELRGVAEVLLRALLEVDGEVVELTATEAPVAVEEPPGGTGEPPP